MARKWSFWERYGQLNFWSKFSFWSSVATLVGLPIGIISLVLSLASLGGAPTIVNALSSQVTITLLIALAALTLFLIFKRFRLLLFVPGLIIIPASQQPCLLN